MKHDYNLEFLRYKIAQTGTALCSFHLSGFSNTSYIIHSTSVDDQGNICFSMIDSLAPTNNDDLKAFRLKLFFYKKGLGYHLNIEACASATYYIVDSGTADNSSTHNMLYVKAKILSAEYTETGKNSDLATGGILLSMKKKFLQITASIFM